MVVNGCIIKAYGRVHNSCIIKFFEGRMGVNLRVRLLVCECCGEEGRKFWERLEIFGLVWYNNFWILAK